MSKKVHQLASNSYGSGTTIGPRQTAIIADIYTMISNGLRCGVNELSMRHPRASLKGTPHDRRWLAALRARGLVTGPAHDLRLSQIAYQVAAQVMRSTVAPGLGLVATQVPTKK